MAEHDLKAIRSIQKIHIHLRAGDERAGVVGDIDFKKANVSADLDLAPDRRQRLAARGGPQVLRVSR